ncbi:MAG: hypothetical protein NTV46_06800, partial [Verrucomicrobia bacterium]|nr:hypothetical protein [Verrucomicrobiota bacterium]
AVRPRPLPAEIWWGGLSTNQQLLDPTKPWDFVKRFQDGLFFHSAGYGGLTATDKQTLAAQLRPFNARYWVELGGGTDTPGDAWVTFQGDTGWGAHLNSQQNLGLVMSQITHDYHMENMEAVCRVHPGWPANDQIAWWTGDLSIASTTYPFTSGLWRDVFNLYYADNPHLKIGHTSSSVYWYWGAYPQLAGAWNNLLYDPLKDANGVPIQVNGSNVSFSFNGRDVILAFVRMAAAGSHPYFSLQTDFPWDYFGAWGDQASARLNREKIRTCERELQARGARHTLICNVSNADAQSGGNDAQDAYYKTQSLNSMTLHQAEGGRANVYLFESWYDGIPHAAAPESKAGSYTNLARDAIKYLKGIADVNGTPEPLDLTLLSTGTTSVVRLQNNGDIACLPALAATESGDATLTAQYFDAQNADITAAMLSAEGWTYTSQLAPGASTTISIVTSAPPGTVDALRRTASLEAFWNPQDPTGLVRDRLALQLRAGAFANWLASYFSPAELANPLLGDPDSTPAGDGLTNLLKYALGLAPRTPATTGITLAKSGGNWLFTYRRPASRADLIYSVEVTPTLSPAAWTSTNVTHTRIATGSTETWQASYPASGARTTFLRLRVTLR